MFWISKSGPIWNVHLRKGFSTCSPVICFLWIHSYYSKTEISFSGRENSCIGRPCSPAHCVMGTLVNFIDVGQVSGIQGWWVRALSCDKGHVLWKETWLLSLSIWRAVTCKNTYFVWLQKTLLKSVSGSSKEADTKSLNDKCQSSVWNRSPCRKVSSVSLPALPFVVDGTLLWMGNWTGSLQKHL